LKDSGPKAAAKKRKIDHASGSNVAKKETEEDALPTLPKPEPKPEPELGLQETIKMEQSSFPHIGAWSVSAMQVTQPEPTLPNDTGIFNFDDFCSPEMFSHSAVDAAPLSHEDTPIDVPFQLGLHPAAGPDGHLQAPPGIVIGAMKLEEKPVHEHIVIAD
jgi:hypothetical protein